MECSWGTPQAGAPVLWKNTPPIPCLMASVVPTILGSSGKMQSNLGHTHHTPAKHSVSPNGRKCEWFQHQLPGNFKRLTVHLNCYSQQDPCSTTMSDALLVAKAQDSTVGSELGMPFVMIESIVEERFR